MNPQDTNTTVARSATHFLTGTFISRITGMVRDLTMAYWYGTSPAVAAFLLAFRLSNLLRRLFGEGALLNGFIPFFEGKRKKDPKEAALFFRDLFWSLVVILSFIIIGLEAFIGAILYYCDLSYGTSQILKMMMCMVPGLIFICLFGLSIALLQCERNFFIPGIAPVAFNLVWIVAVWFCRHQEPYKAMMGTSIGVVFAFFLQWWVTTAGLKKYASQFLTLREWFNVRLFTQELKDMVIPLLLGVVGVAAVQINSAVDVIIARWASLEGPAYLSYAHRLQQLPLALFGIAIASALMPPLTRAIKNDDHKNYKSLLKFGFGRTFTLLFPGTVAIFLLGGASVNLLYGRGEFNNISTIQTTYCLWGYGLGLVPSAFVLLLAPAFYARRDFWTPTLASLISVGLNLMLNIILVFGFSMGTLGISIATSIAAYYNARFLLSRLHIRILSAVMPTVVKVVFSSLVAGVATLLFGHFFMHDPTIQLFLGDLTVEFSRTFIIQLREFIVLTSFFGSIFLLMSFVLRIDHVLSMLGFSRGS